jgi:hypothetical protein
VSLSTVNRAQMAYDHCRRTALELMSGGRKRENMSVDEEKALLARSEAAGAGELLNTHDFKAAYENTIGHKTSNSHRLQSSGADTELATNDHLGDDLEGHRRRFSKVRGSVDTERVRCSAGLRSAWRSESLVPSDTGKGFWDQFAAWRPYRGEPVPSTRGYIWCSRGVSQRWRITNCRLTKGSHR